MVLKVTAKDVLVSSYAISQKPSQKGTGSRLGLRRATGSVDLAWLLKGVSLPDHTCKVEAGNQPLEQGLKGIGTPRLARGDKLHHKFTVIDNKTVITGSFNWSPSAAHTNDEPLMVIESHQLAPHFTREMDRLWDASQLGITPQLQRKLDRQWIRCGEGVERN